MKKILTGAVVSIVTVLALPAIASAHVVVTPNQASVGERVLFTVSVPNEKEVAVSSIKLDIPGGLEDVQPDVMAGWDIITTTTDSNNNVTSITWTGNIPVGQRADLEFKAQAPAHASELDWKAYQMYADGTMVHWDQKPIANAKDDDSSQSGPYSITKVTDDLSADAANSASSNSSHKDTLALVFSVAALVLSLGSLFLRRK